MTTYFDILADIRCLVWHGAWAWSKYQCVYIGDAREPKRPRGRGARTGVDVDALPAGDGVHAHDGVHALDGLAAHGVARRAGAVRLRDRGVHRGEALEVLLEAGAEGRVERVAVVCGRAAGRGRRARVQNAQSACEASV